MGNIQKTGQALAKISSENLLTVSHSTFDKTFSDEVEQARMCSETMKEYEDKLVVISQERALARADINQEWIERCKTPQNTKKELTKVRTLNDAIDLLSPSLFKIAGLKNKKYAVSYIGLWIVDLQAKLNIKNPMNEAMITEASDTIFSEFGYLTIPDVKIVFTDALNGVYGEFYESLSIPKMISWFREYAERRMQEFELRNAADHSYRKNDISGWQERRRKTEISASDYLDINRARDDA